MTDQIFNEYTSQVRAAALLGVHPMNLSKWIRRYGVKTHDLGNIKLVNVEEVRKVLISNGKLLAQKAEAATA